MEAGDRAAGDSDKQERKQIAGPHRAGAVNKLGQRRHGQGRAHDKNAHRQADDGANFQESGEVVARGQQQPHRQHRRYKAVAHQHPGQLHAGEVKPRRPGRALRHPAAGDNGKHQQHQADDRHFADAAGAQIADIDPHKNRQRNGKGDGIGAPRAVGQGFHHDHRQYREDNDHDHKGRHQRNHADGGTHLLFYQLAERAAVAAGRDPGQHHARQQPDHPRQVAHLRGQHRPHQRAGPGNSGKMVTEQHFFVRRHIVEAVVMAHRRRHARSINLQHILRDIEAVKAVGNKVDTDCGNHYPQRINLFAAVESDIAEGKGPDHRQHRP